MRYWARTVIVFLAMLVLTSCSGGNSTSDSGGGVGNQSTQVSVYLEMGQASMPPEVKSISIEISAQDMSAITQSMNLDGTVTVTVPNGAGRHFLVNVRDAANDIIYQGELDADLNGTARRLDIPMSYVGPFSKTYGGTSDDHFASAVWTSDGGYIVVGETYSFGAGGADLWALKLDSDGTILWETAYGGGSNEYAVSVQQTSDEGYIAAGYSYTFGQGSTDAWVVKLDSGGGVTWDKSYGGVGAETAAAIRQTTEGGYVVGGRTGSFGAGSEDFWILKLNSDGSIAWQKAYGGASQEYIRSISQTPDGGYIVAGDANSFGAGSSDVWILKLSSGGSITWQKAYGDVGSEFVHSIQPTLDGGYIAAADTDSLGTRDFLILKLNSSGDITWQKTYGGSGSDNARSIRQISDGGYIICGYTNSFGAGSCDAWVLKLNSAGNVEWQKAFGGSNVDWVFSVEQNPDHYYILAGYNSSFGAGGYDAWILKLGANGDCASFGVSTTATVQTSSIVPTTTLASVVDTNVSPSSTGAIVTHTNATVQQQTP